jgi:hypothetical protein
MSSSSPFYSRLLATCLAEAADSAAPEDGRVLAARVAGWVLRTLGANELAHAEAAGAVLTSIGQPAVTEPLLRALGRSARGDPRLAVVFERVGSEAWAARDFGTAGTVVLLMLAHDSWAQAVPERWLESITDAWLFGSQPDSRRLARLVEHLVRRGPVPPWLRERVTTFPKSFLALDLSPGCRRELHRAAPSVEGWRSFATTPPWVELPLSWEPAEFAEALPQAIATLQQALGEQPRDRTSVVLARWLVELAGTCEEEGMTHG